MLENHGLFAKHVVFDDSEKFEISRFGTTFQNDLESQMQGATAAIIDHLPEIINYKQCPG